MPMEDILIILQDSFSNYFITCIVGILAGLIILNILFPNKLQLKEHKLIIVITGCDSGFGLLTSIKLYQKGFIVIPTCLTEEGIQRLKDISHPILCDVTKDEDIIRLKSFCEEISNQFKANLWAVINNAGIGPAGPFEWMQQQSIEKVMDVNFMGPVRIVRNLLPILKTTKYSRIINISSLAGLVGNQSMGPYCASKHALEGLMKCLREELQFWNIQVCNINPGFMRTPIITAAIEQSRKIYSELPPDIQQFYDLEDYMKYCSAIESIQQNPEQVVRAIENVIYAKRTSFNTIVAGYSTNLIRIFLALPGDVKEMLKYAIPLYGFRRNVINSFHDKNEN